MDMNPPFEQSALQAIAEICAEQSTGREISHFLQSAYLPDSDPKNTKWIRIYNAFVEFQNENQTSNNICKYIKLTFNPHRYVGRSAVFHEVISRLNKHLALCGLEFQEDGNLHRVQKASTLSEAELRAQRLRQQLEIRKVHPKVMQFAESEIATDNYFHTVLEAMKSISATLQSISGYYDDGANLVDYTLLGDTPRFVINDYKTQSQKSEQKGFGNLLKGLYSTFRNPTAHEAKITWELSEADALDVLCMISYVHRKLEHIKPR